MVYIAIIVVIFIFDFVIKELIERWGEGKEKTYIIKDKVFLTRTRNKGAALNFLEKKEKVVAAASLLLTVLCVILFVITLGRKGGSLLKLGLSMLLGGAFSNTYDRLKRKYVVDYLGFGKGKVIFNLSDFFIMIGALLVVVAKK